MHDIIIKLLSPQQAKMTIQYRLSWETQQMALQQTGTTDHIILRYMMNYTAVRLFM